MALTLQEEVLAFVARNPGLTDREITNLLRDRLAPQQPVNIACRSLRDNGFLDRRSRADGLIGNWVAPASAPPTQARTPGPLPPARTVAPPADLSSLSEDALKVVLGAWLEAQGWSVTIMMGKAQGIDIEAVRGSDRWVIEVKGPGSLSAMRVNYFLAILGETLQRMSDPAATYSIALPNMQQYRRLWDRLPSLAKERTGITAIFIGEDGAVHYDRLGRTTASQAALEDVAPPGGVIEEPLRETAEGPSASAQAPQHGFWRRLLRRLSTS